MDKIVIYDTETTNSTIWGSIIEVGAVVVDKNLKEIGKLWVRTNPEITPTVPVTKPLRQIDYILVRPKERWKVVETKILDEAVASDHRAIFAVIELVD